MAETYNVWLKYHNVLVTIKMLFRVGYLPLPMGYIHV